MNLLLVAVIVAQALQPAEPALKPARGLGFHRHAASVGWRADAAR